MRSLRETATAGMCVFAVAFTTTLTPSRTTTGGTGNGNTQYTESALQGDYFNIQLSANDGIYFGMSNAGKGTFIVYKFVAGDNLTDSLIFHPPQGDTIGVYYPGRFDQTIIPHSACAEAHTLHVTIKSRRKALHILM